jgi:hypothetical protein
MTNPIGYSLAIASRSRRLAPLLLTYCADHCFTGEFESTPDLTFSDGANWYMSATDFSDWSNLVDRFDMQGLEGINYSI